MWTVQLIFISFGVFTLITDAVGLEDQGEGSMGIGRAFIYASNYGYNRSPRTADGIGWVNVEDSSQCCQACRDKFTDHQIDLFNFGWGSRRRGTYKKQCTCLENKFGGQIDTKEAGLVTGTCDPCYEFDVLHMGKVLNRAGSDTNYYPSDTAKNCAWLCRQVPDCLWFNWDKNEQKCWLMAPDGGGILQMRRLGGVSGPKNCPKDNDGGSVEVDGDLGDGKGFSLLMDDLYLGRSGISSARNTSGSNSCCYLCQGSYPETQMFQYYGPSQCDCYKSPAGKPVPTQTVDYLAGTCGTD